MARVVAGDEATLRARPPLSSLVCTIAPLAQDAEGMEAALVFAEAGLPVGFMSMANAGSTGPATIPGTIAAADAEIVAALVLVQLVQPGAPVFHSLMPGLMDRRTGGHLATTWEGEVAYPVGVELAHAWGVPTLAGVFGTDAPVPGWQAAAEAAVALTLCALCGAETGGRARAPRRVHGVLPRAARPRRRHPRAASAATSPPSTPAARRSPWT